MTEIPSLKILCVGAHRSPSNAWRRVLTLRRMGHQVETLNTSGRVFFRSSRLTRIVNRVAGKILRAKLARELCSKVLAFQPDVVFVEKGTWITRENVDKLRGVGPIHMKIAHYNPDDPFGAYRDGWEIFKQAIPAYDIHFVPKKLNIPEYKDLGARKVSVFDRAFDPTLHRPVELTEAEKQKYGCDIGFIGTWAPQREEMLAGLVQAGLPLALWGNGWQNGKHWKRLKPYHRGYGQYDEDYVKCINGMKIALHFLRHENRDLQDSRTFEIPACGVCMLAEWSEDHARLFQADAEAVFFHDDVELIEKVRYYLSNDTERMQVAEQGLEKVRNAGYTHANRLKSFLNAIAAI